ncbi:MAG: hypothetical protein KF878_25075 [Planctomycetes bacterium]|nr:hypothetical protein [Planctomycetota bacterium]
MPRPADGRRLRDAGWAHLDLGARDRAGALARDALRGLPLDLDALALLARVDAAAVPRLHGALRLEAGELDGPLGRGLLLVRAGLAYGRQALAAEGADLLRARMAGDPGVFPAALFVARAAGEPDTTDPLPWLDALALVPEPPPASPEERADAAALAAGGWTSDPVADRERFRRACALDPLSARARWELAHLRHRTEAGSIDALLEFARYARLKPNTAVRFVQRVNDTWKAVAASSPRVDVERARALAPDDPTYRLPDVADRYLGLVYAGSTRPAYTRGAPLEVRRALDALLARDARLIGFLAVRAHLSELLGRPGAAERDLDLLERAFADERDAQEKHLDGFWVTLQRVAVRAARRPNRPALEALARLPRPLPHDGSDGNDLDNWLRRDPIFEPIRRDPDFQDLLARWR